MRSALAALSLTACAALRAAAADGDFLLAQPGHAAPLFVAASDWPGVARAASDLQADIERVTGVRPSVSSGAPEGDAVVLVGTLGRSTLIDSLAASGKLDTSGIRGRWEAFEVAVVERPLPGVARALVIAGSDKRGTIYGVYDVSSRIGVSPWYWWADVPVEHHAEVRIDPRPQVDPGPAVRYRGIFLNDEEPALGGWAREKFGGNTSQMYAHVFELLLRLRGNYLWPAMWRSAFNEDDPADARLADMYGVVMGTSHHEPMLRAQQEWKRHGSGPWDYAANGEVLREFWAEGIRRNRDFESVVTVGMRGDGDVAMSEETNVRLLESVVSDQRSIIARETGRPAETVPQLWALYKEVQAYYEHGMRVPDDVTLLWCDDNWGNIRRLPTPQERARPGGAGVYYHFDYVGDPRNYKWVNTVPISKVWEQMHLALEYGADRIWIVNVGDLKPMEFPIEFFLSYAWRPASIPADGLESYSRAWASRQFGEAHAEAVARLINGYTKLNSRRKPELLSAETFSLVNYREDQAVLDAWSRLEAEAAGLERELDPSARPAFFQLVYQPIRACRIVTELYITAGRNRLYAAQGRTEANDLAARASGLFRDDAALTRQWDAMLGGKWRHMMDQTHLGYTGWQQPVRNVMPAVCEVQAPVPGSLAIAVEGDPAARPGDFPVSEQGIVPALSRYGPASRWIDVFNRGQEPVRFSAQASDPWLRVSVDGGEVGACVRVEVSVDWAKAPPGLAEGRVTIRALGGGAPLVTRVPVDNRAVTHAGFVEAAGCVAIEAPHYDRALAPAGTQWVTLPDFGRTLGGVTSFPATAARTEPGGDAPRLEYDLFLFSTGDFPLELQCAPSLDFQPAMALSLAVSLDDGPPQVLRLDTSRDWARAVSDGIARVQARLHVARPGPHVLKVWRVTPAVVLERIVLDTGGLRPSYLGPPESRRFPLP